MGNIAETLLLTGAEANTHTHTALSTKCPQTSSGKYHLMSLLPGSRLATVIVATRCDKLDPVARQPELLWQTAGKLFRWERNWKRRRQNWIQPFMNSMTKRNESSKKNMRSVDGESKKLWSTNTHDEVWHFNLSVCLPHPSVFSCFYSPTNPACQQSFDLWGGMLCEACSQCTVCVNTHIKELSARPVDHTESCTRCCFVCGHTKHILNTHLNYPTTFFTYMLRHLSVLWEGSLLCGSSWGFRKFKCAELIILDIIRHIQSHVQ